jgi:hypothetical protein
MVPDPAWRLRRWFCAAQMRVQEAAQPQEIFQTSRKGQAFPHGTAAKPQMHQQAA